MMEELAHISAKVDEIHRRLFVDNGKPSIQTVLRQHSDILSVMRWILVTLVGAVVMIIVKKL
jgi:hypothetical protein